MSDPGRTDSYKVGEVISASGIYSVLHGGHRSAHEVTLLSGERFPRCSACGDDVSFQLLQAAPTLDNRDGFHVRLYEVPHAEDADRAITAKSA